jgi:hypothetical protein
MHGKAELADGLKPIAAGFVLRTLGSKILKRKFESLVDCCSDSFQVGNFIDFHPFS